MSTPSPGARAGYPPRTLSSIVAGAASSGVVLTLALAVRVVAGRPWEDGGSASYPWSGPIHSQVSLATILLVAGCCYVAGRRWMVVPSWVAAGTVVWPLLALMAEVSRDGTSHNLLPLEVATWSVVFVPAMLATHLGRRSVRSRRLPAQPRTESAALPVGLLALMIGVLGRLPVRHRWWHRYLR